jgi:predicted RNA-binding Zn-ribbon protein involved in translation (DUF1610 family)
MRRSIIWTVEKEKLNNFVKESTELKNVLCLLGLPALGGNYNTLKKRIKEDNIDISHIRMGCGHGKGKTTNRRISIVDMFIANSNIDRAVIRRRLIKDKLIPYECSGCGNTGVWNNKQITLHLEHKNGIRNDNRLENLEFLCPNCHSQTDTYCGKNNKTP